MEPYRHKVHYYETDKMGITHHSNYIRWMEEARTDYLEKLGCPYKEIEEAGCISPVVSVDCKYKISTTYADEVRIFVELSEYTGVKFSLHYIMKNAEDKIVCDSHSTHCLTDERGRPVRIPKRFPGFDQLLREQLTLA